MNRFTKGPKGTQSLGAESRVLSLSPSSPRKILRREEARVYLAKQSLEIASCSMSWAALGYFRKLLALNPDWVWRQVGSIPMRDGFLNHLHQFLSAKGLLESLLPCALPSGGLVWRVTIAL